MKLFRFDKWFFDFLTPDREYVLCYLADFELPGFRATRFNLSIARPSGAAPIVSGHPLRIRQWLADDGGTSIVTDHGPVRIGPNRTELDLVLPGGTVSLRYETDLPFRRGLPGSRTLHIPRNRGRSIAWSPVMISGRASGRVALKGFALETENCPGYVDRVSSTLFPTSTPVRCLHWGRFLHPACSLTYTVAGGADRHWTSLVAQTSGGFRFLKDFSLEVTEWSCSPETGLRYPSAFRINATGPDRWPALTVAAQRSAIESDFFETEPPWFRRLFRSLAHSPRGVKYFCRADISGRLSGRPVDLKEVEGIAEFVQFKK